jgi:hypothetical protein
MNKNQTPNAFVWTKVQAEAGQSLDRILNRKELERKSGGTFWWGIGESKAEKVMLLVAQQPCVAVLFTKMLSSPNLRDSDPEDVLLWEAYETAAGKIPLPPHAIVTSRAHDRKGSLKSRHYALVCANQRCILGNGGGTLDSGALRNVGSNGKSVGSSQVTAVVERTTYNGEGQSYPITTRATLIAPYAVQLAKQRKLSAAELRLLDDASLSTMAAYDWIRLAKQLRRIW